MIVDTAHHTGDSSILQWLCCLCLFACYFVATTVPVYAASRVYIWKDASGVTYIRDQPPATDAASQIGEVQEMRFLPPPPSSRKKPYTDTASKPVPPNPKPPPPPSERAPEHGVRPDTSKLDQRLRRARSRGELDMERRLRHQRALQPSL